MTEPLIDFSTLIPIDFTVVSESYSRYRLDDGTILLAKLVLTKIFKVPNPDPSTEVQYQSASSFVLTSISPVELRGKPTVPMPDVSKLGEKDSVTVQIKAESEPWNQYQLPDGTSMFPRIRINGARRTQVFSGDGDPVYIISSQTNGFRLDKDLVYHPMLGAQQIPPQRSQSIPEDSHKP